ncbi:MAG: arginyl-tRNA synthetase [Parcubacteria group bacterium Gr01-1014_18]|nr:MAG: arginyl-tRNA synthetase [Parcubacteria group bacterium Greene0416_36]TSC80942.1 MAG: arginyl-tRNA synthetase [Parcubacteria group bacterium Gr01-1014_18]TSC98715.1 MAG: arginyl-tRNA synthetase [Parcubacteria group bacterium Greene1014_20]
MSIRNQIISILKNILGEQLDISLEHPADNKNGDYSTNICLRLAKEVKKSPRDFGLDLIEKIKAHPEAKLFSKIELAGPGFVNFYLSPEFLAGELGAILEKKEAYGELTLGQGKRVIVEHTSVNPNKAMHVGHLRNSILGDSIARILRKCGYSVQVENYIDDTGVQLADIVTAFEVLKSKEDPHQKFDHICWDLYTEIQKQLAANPELEIKKKEIQTQLEEGSGEFAEKGKELVRKVLNEQMNTMALFNITYDLLLAESSILSSGLWKEVFEELKEKNIAVFEKEGAHAGCWVVRDLDLPNAENMKNSDKVLVTGHGNVVYTAKDIAHHLWKFGLVGGDFGYELFEVQLKNYDSSLKDLNPSLYSAIFNQHYSNPYFTVSKEEGETGVAFGKVDLCYTVVDIRQAYSFDVIKAVFKKLGFEKQADALNHVAYGFVSLSRNTAKELGVDVSDNAASYPMSGRKGIGVKVDDLWKIISAKVKGKILEGGKGVLQYALTSAEVEKVVWFISGGALKAYMLKFSPHQELVFDFDEALKMTGDSGPYLQYTHARICGILRKGGPLFVGTYVQFARHLEGKLSKPTELDLLRTLYLFPEMVELAAREVSPHFIYSYLITLSQKFNSFYASCRVLGAENPDIEKSRLALIAGTAQIIKNGLNLLGIEAPERM